MSRPININDKNAETNLFAGKYRIYIIGGWGVKIEDFKVLLKNMETDEIIESRKSFFPVQTYAFGKRAKRILVIDVINS